METATDPLIRTPAYKVATEFPQGAGLPQQIPALVGLYVDPP
jgi:hypothetical protein